MTISLKDTFPSLSTVYKYFFRFHVDASNNVESNASPLPYPKADKGVLINKRGGIYVDLWNSHFVSCSNFMTTTPGHPGNNSNYHRRDAVCENKRSSSHTRLCDKPRRVPVSDKPHCDCTSFEPSDRVDVPAQKLAGKQHGTQSRYHRFTYYTPLYSVGNVFSGRMSDLAAPCKFKLLLRARLENFCSHVNYMHYLFERSSSMV